MGEIPDSKLMEQYVEGCSSAFDELFGRYERRAYAYFLKRSRSPERALRPVSGALPAPSPFPRSIRRLEALCAVVLSNREPSVAGRAAPPPA